MRIGQAPISKTATGKNASSIQTIQRQPLSRNKTIQTSSLTKSEVSEIQLKKYQN